MSWLVVLPRCAVFNNNYGYLCVLLSGVGFLSFCLRTEHITIVIVFFTLPVDKVARVCRWSYSQPAQKDTSISSLWKRLFGTPTCITFMTGWLWVLGILVEFQFFYFLPACTLLCGHVWFGCSSLWFCSDACGLHFVLCSVRQLAAGELRAHQSRHAMGNDWDWGRDRWFGQDAAARARSWAAAGTTPAAAKSQCISWK